MTLTQHPAPTSADEAPQLEDLAETWAASESSALAEAQAEAARYRQALAALTAVCESAAKGDLEPRVEHLGDDPGFREARRAVNNLLDLTDAFVREASASLEFASEAKFFRTFLVRGMLGSFQAGATTINAATAAMAATHGELQQQGVRRLELADSFEAAVLGLSDQVAAAATELEATSRSLAVTAEGTSVKSGTVAVNAVTASDAVTMAAAAVEELASTVGSIELQTQNSNTMGQSAAKQALDAREKVAGLSRASQEIDQVVNLINQVASQTRLLALNATIEAARAGESGKGFAVVASEVKNLAAQTSEATDRIANQVSEMQSATGAVVGAIETISTAVQGMGDNLAAITSAVGEQRLTTNELSKTTTQAATAVTQVSTEIAAIRTDAATTSTGASEMTSASLELSRLSTDLRKEVAEFLQQIR
jgi:methyl-accepting chemotaxis protein